MPLKLLVFGGNGYIGKHICKEGLDRSLEVTGLSRQDPPADLKQAGKGKLSWIVGNALSKDLYRKELPNFDAYIHSIGILFEKSIPYLRPVSPDKLQTYECANRDTALAPLQVLESLHTTRKTEAIPKPFIYMSSAHSIPFLPGYHTNKRAVEAKMMEMGGKKIIRPVIFRPGLVYSDSRYKLLGRAMLMVQKADCMLNDIVGYSVGVPKPIAAETLAKAVVNAAVDPSISGIYQSFEIEKTLKSPDTKAVKKSL